MMRGALSRLIQARAESGLSQREVSETSGSLAFFHEQCESCERGIDAAELWMFSKLYKQPLSFFAFNDGKRS